jgi:hypothetical protein
MILTNPWIGRHAAGRVPRDRHSDLPSQRSRRPRLPARVHPPHVQLLPAAQRSAESALLCRQCQHERLLHRRETHTAGGQPCSGEEQIIVYAPIRTLKNVHLLFNVL